MFFVDELEEISVALLAHIIFKKRKKKVVHENARISCRIIICMVGAWPLISHMHLRAQSQLTSYASRKGI